MPYLVFKDHKWLYELADMDVAEAIEVEKAAGVSFYEWAEKLDGGDMTCLRVLVWVVGNQNGQKWATASDVHFRPGAGELMIEPDEAQVAAEERARAEAEANPPAGRKPRARAASARRRSQPPTPGTGSPSATGSTGNPQTSAT